MKRSSLGRKRAAVLVEPSTGRRRRPLTGPARLGVLAVALAPVTAAVGFMSSPPAVASTAPRTHLVPSVLSGLSLAKFEAPAPSGQVMRIGVSAERPDTAAETRLYDEMYDPSSPQYHHFLTVGQFDREFGLPSSRVSALESWLRSGGLVIDTASAAGDYFTASGSVAHLDKLFHVSIGRYSYEGTQFLANNVAPSVPTDLPIDAVVGLNTLQQFSLDSLTGAVSNVRAGATPPVGPQSGTQETLTPQDLWGVYDDPGAAALTKSSGTSNPATVAASAYDLGQGQTIGIFGEGETSSVVAQLRLFEAAEGLPKVPVRTVYTEGSPPSAYGDNTPDIEWYLDSQSSTGMAPDVSQLDFYFAKSLYDADVFQDFDHWANDPDGPEQMNASFGECEANPTDPVTGPLAEVPYGTEYGDELEAVGDPILRQAAMEGRTLFSSAGDTGSGCPEVAVPVAGAGNGLAVQPVPDVSYPCASPYAVCVGGTVVSVDGSSYPQSAQRSAETSWTFGGGGTSYFIPEPSFQKGVANVDLPCVSTPQGDPYPPGSAPTCRGVPDVSDMSGNVTGDDYFIYSDAEPSDEGGTSLASPLMMGQWARVQAGASRAVQAAGGLGFADPVIYDQASSADSCSSSATASSAATAACTSQPYARDFTNITGSEYGAGNGAYQPGPGWSYAGGWGALNVSDFIADVDCAAQSDGCAAAPRGAAYSLGKWSGTSAAPNFTGAILATDRYGGQEAGADTVTTAVLDGPAGWATDPIDSSAVVPGPDQGSGGPMVPLPGDNQTTNQDPSLDITGASLSATTSTITATISGPDLGSLPPADAGDGGNSYYVAWLYDGVVYYAQADESALTGSWTFSSGNTKSGSYTDTSSSAATGTLTQDGSTSQITIEVPASEVGSPPAGALLSDPQAFDQLDAGSSQAVYLGLTTDSADDLVPVSELQSGDCQADRAGAGELCGRAESIGVQVKVRPA